MFWMRATYFFNTKGRNACFVVVNNEGQFMTQKSHRTKALLPVGPFLVCNKQSCYFHSWSTRCHARWSQEEGILLPFGIFEKFSKTMVWPFHCPEYIQPATELPVGWTQGPLVSIAYTEFTCDLQPGNMGWWGEWQHGHHIWGSVRQLKSGVEWKGTPGSVLGTGGELQWLTV